MRRRTAAYSGAAWSRSTVADIHLDGVMPEPGRLGMIGSAPSAIGYRRAT